MKLVSMKNFGGATLGLLLLLGITFVSSATAQAQYPWPNQDQYRRQRDYERAQQDRYRRDRDRDRDWDDRYNRGRRGRGWDGYPNYGGSYELRQTALNAGYNEGMKVGRNDRRSGRYDPYRSGAYRNASKDYNSRMGDRYAYQQYFRAAFENGYADGYRYGY